VKGENGTQGEKGTNGMKVIRIMHACWSVVYCAVLILNFITLVLFYCFYTVYREKKVTMVQWVAMVLLVIWGYLD